MTNIYGSQGDDLLLGTVENDTVYGDSGNDTLVGEEGDNALIGGYGNDNLNGGLGNDVLDGGTDDDYLYGNEGVDQLFGAAGNDQLSGGDGNDILNGGSGNDILDGGAGSDIYRFGLGSGQDSISYFDFGTTPTDSRDRIILGARITTTSVTLSRVSDDLIIKINGTDDQLRVKSYFRNDVSQLDTINTIEFADGTIWNFAFIKIVSLEGTAESEYLYGYVGNDTLNGGLGDDSILGLAGSDIINGGGGNDTIYGGDNNTLNGDSNDILNGDSGNDLLYGGTGSDRLTGGIGDDTLYGQSGDDILVGEAGDDLLIGDAGSDTYIFGIGLGRDNIHNYDDDNSTDRILFDTGIISSDIILSREVDDLIIKINSTSDQIRVDSYFYNDAVYPYTINTIEFANGTVLDVADIKLAVLQGTDENDHLYGYATNDTLNGSTGDDIIYGGAGDDALNGGAENDLLYGENGVDSLNGGAGNDQLNGGDGNDTLNGILGDDVLEGGDKNDTLDGGIGNDSLTGGDGSDTYLFGIGSGQDTVYNYDSDEGFDRILLNSGLVASDVTLSANGYDLIIRINSTYDQITVQNYFYNNSTDPYTVNIIEFVTGDIWDVTEVQSRMTNLYPKDITLVGSASDSILNGGLGNDDIHGGIGNDTLSGGLGSDWLYGNGGHDLLNGGLDNDNIYGGDGNDILDGGSGNDYLEGWTGSDTYHFGVASGRDTVYMYDGGSSYDRILLGSGITTTGVTLSRDANSLNIQINGTDDHLVVQNYFDITATDVDESDNIEFAEGIVWDINIVKALVLQGTVEADNLYGDSSADTISGEAGNDSIFGGSGNDSLNGNSGNDIIFAGDGADLLNGGVGNDDLKGDEGNDHLIGDLGDDTLYGQVGDDILDGGSGNDTLNDDFGSNTYMFGRGSGHDIVFNYYNDSYYDPDLDIFIYPETPDRILLGFDITTTDIILSRYENNLIISVNETDDQLTIQDYFSTEVTGISVINTLEFEDSTVWDINNIKALVLQGTAEADNLIGYSSADIINGGVGNDELFGKDGNDILDGDSGSDQLNGGSGNDQLSGGTGRDFLYGADGDDILDGGAENDYLSGGNGTNIYMFDRGSGQDYISNSNTPYYDANLGEYIYPEILDIVLLGSGINPSDITLSQRYDDLVITIKDTYDQLFIQSYFATADYQINKIKFVDGTIWDTTTIKSIAALGATGGITLLGNANADTLIGGLGYDYLDGLEGDDTLIGGMGSDILVGGAGSDSLSGNEEVDTMVGGLGNDNYFVENEWDIIFENINEGIDKVSSFTSYTLSQNVDNLTLIDITNINGVGNDLNNVMIGNSGSNVLNGKEGDDTLNGGSGVDTMVGGIGNDIYYVDNLSDQTIEASGAGTDQVYSSVSYSLSSQYIENLILTGSANINATGNSAYNNTLIGNSGSNVLDGKEGDDTLNGGSGVDTMIGGFGNDTYYVDNIDDQIVEASGAGTDQIYSSVSYSLASKYIENLTLTENTNIYATGNSLNNILIGNAGKNVLDGKEGDDTLNGGLGIDRMEGGLGNDTYYVDNVGDVVIEASGAGTDRVYSIVSYSIASQYVENLILTGSANINATGNSAYNNSLIGNSGNNILDGKAGADTYTGSGGSDTVLYQLLSNNSTGGNGSDNWTDFTLGNPSTIIGADKIDIGDLLIGYGGGGTLAALDPYLTVNISGSNTTVLIDRDGAGGTYTDTLLLTLNGVNTNLTMLLNNHQIII